MLHTQTQKKKEKTKMKQESLRMIVNEEIQVLYVENFKIIFYTFVSKPEMVIYIST